MSAPVRHSDFVGHLCIGLAHRWEPERRFMILTAYFDESGTHGGARLSVMAGFLGDARQWRKFEKRTAKLFQRFRVDVFHTIDIRRTDKDFKGWSVDRKIEFMDEFHHIINETVERGFASILKEEDYAYYSALRWPKGARKDSRYALLVRASVASAIDGAIATPNWRVLGEPKLNIVLESGHRNAPDAVRLYDEINRHFGSSGALAGLTFASKADSLPLAAADMFAYSAYGQEVGQKPIGVARRPMKSDASYSRNLYRIPLDRGVLESLHQQACARVSRVGGRS